MGDHSCHTRRVLRRRVHRAATWHAAHTSRRGPVSRSLTCHSVAIAASEPGRSTAAGRVGRHCRTGSRRARRVERRVGRGLQLRQGALRRRHTGARREALRAGPIRRRHPRGRCASAGRCATGRDGRRGTRRAAGRVEIAVEVEAGVVVGELRLPAGASRGVATEQVGGCLGAAPGRSGGRSTSRDDAGCGRREDRRHEQGGQRPGAEVVDAELQLEAVGGGPLRSGHDAGVLDEEVDDIHQLAPVRALSERTACTSVRAWNRSR